MYIYFYVFVCGWGYVHPHDYLEPCFYDHLVYDAITRIMVDKLYSEYKSTKVVQDVRLAMWHPLHYVLKNIQLYNKIWFEEYILLGKYYEYEFENKT